MRTVEICGRCGVVLADGERHLKTCVLEGGPPRLHAPIYTRPVGDDVDQDDDEMVYVHEVDVPADEYDHDDMVQDREDRWHWEAD